jgi:hypothetical protein
MREEATVLADRVKKTARHAEVLRERIKRIEEQRAFFRCNAQLDCSLRIFNPARERIDFDLVKDPHCREKFTAKMIS